MIPVAGGSAPGPDQKIGKLTYRKRERGYFLARKKNGTGEIAPISKNQMVG